MTSSALSGAHTAKLSEKGEQPSLFDVLAQESLTSSLKPATSFLLKVLARVNPQRFASASRWSDELFALFDLLLQNHYLKNYGASFSENFYGMKRILVKAGSVPSSGFAKGRSLLLLVAWPYLKGKFDAIYERLSEVLHYSRPTPNESTKVKLSRIFVKMWPWLKSIASTIAFIMQISYALNWSSSHSLSQFLSGTRLERLTPQDLTAFQGQPLHHAAGILPRLWRFLVSLPGILSRLFGYSLFLLQFIDLFYNSDLGSQLSSSFKQARQAPHKLLSEDQVLNLETSKCPICLSKRTNDTALTCSGYVFCYSCIDSFLKREGCCPITGLPATSSSLVRIFSTPS